MLILFSLQTTKHWVMQFVNKQTKQNLKEKLFEFLCLFDVFVFLELSSFQRTYLLLLFKMISILCTFENNKGCETRQSHIGIKKTVIYFIICWMNLMRNITNRFWELFIFDFFTIPILFFILQVSFKNFKNLSRLSTKNIDLVVKKRTKSWKFLFLLHKYVFF